MVRYDMRRSYDGWALIDTSSGEVARVNGVPQTDLPLEDADDLADLLNLIDREKPGWLS